MKYRITNLGLEYLLSTPSSTEAKSIYGDHTEEYTNSLLERLILFNIQFYPNHDPLDWIKEHTPGFLPETEKVLKSLYEAGYIELA